MSSTMTKASIVSLLRATISNVSGPVSTAANIDTQVNRAISIGTAAGQVDRAYSGQIAITSGTPNSLDLTATTDPTGGAISFGHIRSICIENTSTTAGQDLTVGGGSNAIISALPFTIPPGGVFLIDGLDLTVDGTHKILLTSIAAGTAVGINLTIFGR